eukprot:2395050-Prymnesium_polylepis.1
MGALVGARLRRRRRRRRRRRPSCALQYGRPIRRCGRGRHDQRKTVLGCPGVGSLVRTKFFFFF